MPVQKLCHACQAFLQGTSELSKYGDGYVHHANPESFANAIESGCDICTGLWAEKFVDGDHYPVVFPTTWLWDLERVSGDGAHLALYWYNDNALNLIFEPVERSAPCGQLVMGNSGDEAALAFLVEQYQNCRTQHASCTRTAPSSNYRPRRLLDVALSNDQLIRLREEISIDPTAEYATLSHCWGGIQPFTLSASTKHQLAAGVSMEAFPKTFRDAVFTLRALGLRYLWIDSICIAQDHLEEWHIEAGRMRDIYGNAACCIAATAAENGGIGLFFDRSPKSRDPIIVEATWVQTGNLPLPGKYWCSFHTLLPHHAIDAAPLNRRAWVAQERYLSPRIIHFAKEAIFWECPQILGSEAYPNGIPSDIPVDSGMHSLKIAANKFRRDKTSHRNADEVDGLSSKGPTAHEIRTLWWNFIREYTKCAMSKEADCLIALTGVAQDIGKMLGDRLAAGLWASELLQDLCWFTDEPRLVDDRVKYRPTKWRAPTWSWASSAMPVYRINRFGDNDLDYMATVVNVEVEEKSSGEIISASLDLSCRLLPVDFAVVSCTDNHFNYTISLQGTQLPLELYIDDPNVTASSGSQRMVWLLALFTCTPAPARAYSIRSMSGLIVSRSVRQPRCFERIAHFICAWYMSEVALSSRDGTRKAVQKLLNEHESTEPKLITLI